MNLSTSNKLYRKAYRFLYVLKKNTKYRAEVRGKLKTLGGKALDTDELKKIKKYYSSYNFNDVKTYWHQFYKKINGSFHKEYIPEDLFYSTIEPALNRSELLPALADKNLHGKLFEGAKRPKTIIRNVNGYYLKDNRIISKEQAVKICQQHERLVFKHTMNSGGGVGVMLITLKDGISDFKDKPIDGVFDWYKKDFIAQEVIKQNKVISSLNASSINTLRVISYLREDGVKILSTAIRIGGEGEFLDNVAVSGVACGLNDDGTLKDLGYDKFYNGIHKRDDGRLFKDIRIPFYDKVKNEVIRLHEQVPYFKLISWDIALDDMDEVVMIEFNVKGQGVFTHQLITGPLFGKYTDEVMKISQVYAAT